MVCASERKMGSRESQPQTENIPVLDRVGPTYRPLWRLPPERLSSTVLLANGTFDKDTVLLLHDEDRRTFLIGPCNRLKLDSVNDERECNELRGHRIQQVVFNESGIYVLTEEGMLFSSGVGSCGELGRSTTDVPGHCFGRVPIDGAVIAVAAEGVLVLAMTKKKVYAFGTCWHMTGIYHTPREIYTGKGSDAPKQVACGLDHSVILTVGGQVLTWGRGGYTGQGHTEVIPSMTVVRGLEGLRVQQVGCTRLATYALADAVLIGWGDNGDGSLGVGHRACVGYILEPTVIDCGGHRISNFRCSSSMMLAVTDNNEALYWGRCSNGSVINRPQPVEGYEFPRQILARDRRSDSGGVVYPTSPDECHDYQATSLHALQPGSRTKPAWKKTGIETIVQDMEDKLIRQQLRIDELEYSGSDLQQLSIELLTQKDQQQKRIEELQCNSKRQQLHMRDLKANNDKQQQRLDTLQENSNKQQQQIEELEDSVNCPVCFANRRRVIFRCGHGVCQDCAPRIDFCPICRGQIRGRILIY